MNLPAIQEELQKHKFDGWLFYDHHERDPLAYRILGLNPSQHVTRRWYYLIPVSGEPTALVHRIEAKLLDSLPGGKLSYSSWREQVEGLGKLLRGHRIVAMQYSPLCQIPYISLVDAGTVELVRGTGVQVVSSAELIQIFEAQLDAQGLATHLEAGRLMDHIRAETFLFIRDCIHNSAPLDEFLVQQFVRSKMAYNNLISDSGPIVGVNANAGDPHYEPKREQCSPIASGDLILLDMWAKLGIPGAVFYDITWTGFCGLVVPQHVQTVFEAVRDARDKAIAFVESAFERGEVIRGFEVDDAARNHINSLGYGKHFVHRTGHSIGKEVHGNGANMDNLEIHDERKIIPWTCFSIEPGIYFDDFGIRSEVNVFIEDRTSRVTGEVQRELVRIA